MSNYTNFNNNQENDEYHSIVDPFINFCDSLIKRTRTFRKILFLIFTELMNKIASRNVSLYYLYGAQEEYKNLMKPLSQFLEYFMKDYEKMLTMINEINSLGDTLSHYKQDRSVHDNENEIRQIENRHDLLIERFNEQISRYQISQFYLKKREFFYDSLFNENYRIHVIIDEIIEILENMSKFNELPDEKKQKYTRMVDKSVKHIRLLSQISLRQMIPVNYQKPISRNLEFMNIYGDLLSMKRWVRNNFEAGKKNKLRRMLPNHYFGIRIHLVSIVKILVNADKETSNENYSDYNNEELSDMKAIEQNIMIIEYEVTNEDSQFYQNENLLEILNLTKSFLDLLRDVEANINEERDDELYSTDSSVSEDDSDDDDDGSA